MRHGVYGRKFGRDFDERKALFKSLVRELVSHGKITTTIAKAKAVQPLAEKLVTKAKVGSLQKRRELLKILPKENISFFVDSVGSRFRSRAGGYTRIIKIGSRTGDNAPMAILEWVEQIAPMHIEGKSKAKKSTATAKIEDQEAAVSIKEEKSKTSLKDRLPFGKKKSTEESKPEEKKASSPKAKNSKVATDSVEIPTVKKAKEGKKKAK